jgi:hypothetical protein
MLGKRRAIQDDRTVSDQYLESVLFS